MPTVPDVVSRTETDAIELLQGEKLNAKRREVSNANIAKGTIISSEPSAGAEVTEGTEVTIDVSTGPAAGTPIPDTTASTASGNSEPADTEVPSIAGKTELEARNLIEDARLVVGKVTPASSSSMSKGSAIDSDPAAGRRVRVGSTVDLTISTGADRPSGPVPDDPEQPVDVPDLFGMPLFEARRVLAHYGLQLGMIS